MALWRDGVSVTVQIAFATNPLATPTWTDVTDYVREVPSVRRGRTTEYGDFAPGTASVVFDNRTGRFDPEYTSGAYYPNVKPMKRIRITWAFDVSSGTVFDGFVLSWPQHERDNADNFVTVTCVDGTRFLENAVLPLSAYDAEVLADGPWTYYPVRDDVTSDSGIDQLVDAVGSYNLSRSGSSGSAVVGSQTAPIGGESAIVSAAASVAPTYTARFESLVTEAAKTVELWATFTGAEVVPADGSNVLAYAQVDNTNGVRTGFYGDETRVRYSHSVDNLSTSGDVTLRPVPWESGKPHHIVITRNGNDLELYVNGQMIDSTTLSAGTTTMQGEPNTLLRIGHDATTTEGEIAVSHLAFYTDGLSATRVFDHYTAGAFAFGHPYGERSGERIGRAADAAGWPTGLRDIDDGTMPQGVFLPAGGTLLEYVRQVEASEQGMAFMNVDGELRFIDRQTLWSAASVATFSDNPSAGELKFHDIVRGTSHATIRNIVTTSYNQTGAITRKDQTSIDEYLEARELIEAPTLPTGELASNLSAYVLRERKDPRTVVSQLATAVRIDGGDNEADTLLGLEIGDKVTVERQPPGAGAWVDADLIIQGMQHRIDDEQWRVTLYLSPAPTSSEDAPYLTLGDADDGKIGAADGNLIPA